MGHKLVEAKKITSKYRIATRLEKKPRIINF